MQKQSLPTKSKAYEPSIPALEEFLKNGVHFGHKTSHWNPKMAQYIYGSRNGIHIIDVIKTMKALKKALVAIHDASERGTVLFVGTKGQAATVLETVAEESGAFYVTTRWPGGLFTNYNTLKRTIRKYMDLEQSVADALGEDILKKEALSMRRDVARLDKIYRGLKLMDKLPSMIVVIDSRSESVAIKEARKVGIPIVAMLDTNCDPAGIDYPIPSNDDSIKSISMIVKLIGDAVKSGRKSETLRSLRKNYEAELAQRRTDALRRKATQDAQKEEEMNRIKRIKEGVVSDAVSSKSVEENDEKSVKDTVSGANEAKTKEVKFALEGVTDKIMVVLQEAGFDSVSKVQKASDDQLLSLKGVGPKAVEAIRKATK
jgi:small subunit ribosomal protein S2